MVYVATHSIRQTMAGFRVIFCSDVVVTTITLPSPPVALCAYSLPNFSIEILLGSTSTLHKSQRRKEKRAYEFIVSHRCAHILLKKQQYVCLVCTYQRCLLRKLYELALFLKPLERIFIFFAISNTRQVWLQKSYSCTHLCCW